MYKQSYVIIVLTLMFMRICAMKPSESSPLSSNSTKFSSHQETIHDLKLKELMSKHKKISDDKMDGVFDKTSLIELYLQIHRILDWKLHLTRNALMPAPLKCLSKECTRK